MSNRTVPRRFLYDLPNWIRVAQGTDPSLQLRDSDTSEEWSPTQEEWAPAQTAAWNILIDLRRKKDKADPRAIQFFRESYSRLTEHQQQEVWRAIHAKRGRPRREPDHENTGIGNSDTRHSIEPDIEIVVARLSNLTSSQLRSLSKIISSRKGRPPLSATPAPASRLGQPSPDTTQQDEQTTTLLDLQIKLGARAEQLIEERRNARKGGIPLRGDGAYRTVMDDAMDLFDRRPRTLARAHEEFKWRHNAGMVDSNGDYVDVQPLDDEYRENEAS